MRRFLLLLVPFAAACTPTSSPPSLAYINSGLVMRQYHGTLAKRQVIEAQAKIWQRSLDSLITSLGASHLSAAEQEMRVGQYRRVLQQRVQAAGQQADQELLKEVNQYLKEYGKREKYDFIFGATEAGNIVYATASKDLTSEVIQHLNQQYDHQHGK